jgi:hypothetical protein
VRASACRQKVEAGETLSVDRIDPIRMHIRYEVPPTTSPGQGGGAERSDAAARTTHRHAQRDESLCQSCAS